MAGFIFWRSPGVSQPSLPPFTVCFPAFLPSISPATLPSSSVCDNISHLLKPPSTLHLAARLLPSLSPWVPPPPPPQILSRCPRARLAPAPLTDSGGFMEWKQGYFELPLRSCDALNVFLFRERQTDRQTEEGREGVRRRSLSQAFPCLTSLTCFCKLVGNKTLLAGAGRKYRHFVPVTAAAFIPSRRTLRLAPGCASEKISQGKSFFVGWLAADANNRAIQQANGFNVGSCF